MGTLAEFRQQYPQYNDMSDGALADRLHAKFYSDIPRSEFNAKIGFDPLGEEAKANLTAMKGDLRPARPGDEISRDTVLPFRETMGPDGKPVREFAVPGLIMEPVRAAERLFTQGTAPGAVPMSQAPAAIAEQQIGDVMAAGSVAMPGTHMPRVTVSPAVALERAAADDAALGPVMRGHGADQRPSPALQSVPREVDPAAAQMTDKALGPQYRRDAPPSPTLGGKPRDELMAAAERLGIELPVALASDNFLVRGVAAPLKENPFGGAPIVRSTRMSIDDLESLIARQADQRSQASADTAGRMLSADASAAVRRATQDPVESVSRDLGGSTPGAAGARAATEIDRLVHQRTQQQVDQASRDMGSGSRAGAGQSVRDSATDWIERRSVDEASQIYSDINAFMPGSGGRLTRTADALRELSDAAEAAGLPAPQIAQQLRRATSAQGLSFEGLQNLRTHIGDMLSGRVTPEPNMNLRALDRVYSALSEDLRDMARGAMSDLAREHSGLEGKRRLTAAQRTEIESAGERGVELWDQANARFRDEIALRREQIAQIIGQRGDATPEAIVDRLAAMATSRGGGDIGRLQVALQAISPEARRELLSAIVGRMGRDTDGFNQSRFRASWEALSPEGRNILFGQERGIEQRLASAVAASRDLEPLAELIGRSPEALVDRVVRMAGDKGGADIAVLRRLHAALGREAWDELAGTVVGRMGQTPTGYSPDAFRRAFGSLSDEGQSLLLGNRPAARELLREASASAERLTGVAELIGAPGERVVSDIIRLAGTKGGADIQHLQQVMRQIATPETREAVSAAIIRKMGQNKDGFSPALFRTELSKMSPVGRQIVFSPELNQVLTDIDTLSQRFDQLAKLGNPSGTARTVGITSGVATVGGSIVAGTMTPILVAAGGIVGTYVLARMLARPATARAVKSFVQEYGNAQAVGNVAQAKAAVAALIKAAREPGRMIEQQELGEDMRK